MIDEARFLDLAERLKELKRRRSGLKLETFYPDEGPLRRELYPKHLEFFRLGKAKRERLFIAANRVGKTEGAGGFELVCHLTGRYPPWWEGRRFTRGNAWWAAGDTRATVRDILQRKLLGKPGDYGTGLIPRDCIIRTAPGFIPDAVEAVWVRHASGGTSVVQFKSYDQGREAFQGTEQDGVWLDEEPPEAIYTECLLRTMTNNGMAMLTFTPLRGMSSVVLAFMPGGAAPEKQEGSKAVVSATWDDVPHLSEQAKAELWAAIPPFQRDARSKGLPQLGAGLIYPVPESVFAMEPFDVPKHWPRSYGMDVGWNKTAALFGAYDRETDTGYLYSEHYQGEVEPAVHVAAIKARGRLPGAIDPAANGRSQLDGRKLMQEYRDLGLELVEAANAVEAGIFAVWERFSTGRLKVFRTCQNLLSELRLYRRDERGKVVKERDHACVVADTMVETREGPQRIADLAGTEGEVLTVGGAWVRYRNARLTRRDAPVVRVTFADGRNVVCTPDHRFLTPRGWLEAKELVGHSVYDAVSQRIQRTQWTRSSFLQPARSFWDAATTFAASTFSAMASGFTVLCGALRTGPSPRALTFTTGTRIAATIPWPTWSSHLQGSMRAFTTEESREPSLPRHGMPQSCGTPAPRDTRGTESTSRSTERGCSGLGSSSAGTVASASWRGTQAITASAPTAARRSGATALVSTTRNALASFAARLLWRIATGRNRRAREAAVSRCLSVTEAGTANVYCLEVPGPGAFAIAGGLVVHNCDALRYWTMTGIDIARAPMPAKPPADPLLSQAHGGGSWMG